uniref:Uncharacterized protein n=1 Tax=Anguilla anguilla TaxID=7936 RepID=A0A0E9WYJ6_ANGAN
MIPLPCAPFSGTTSGTIWHTGSAWSNGRAPRSCPRSSMSTGSGRTQSQGPSCGRALGTTPACWSGSSDGAGGRRRTRPQTGAWWDGCPNRTPSTCRASARRWTWVLCSACPRHSGRRRPKSSAPTSLSRLALTSPSGRRRAEGPGGEGEGVTERGIEGRGRGRRGK